MSKINRREKSLDEIVNFPTNHKYMKLLHNAYTTSLSFEEAVSEVLRNRSVEIDLAVSGTLFLYEDDFGAVWNSYEAYFENAARVRSQLSQMTVDTRLSIA